MVVPVLATVTLAAGSASAHHPEDPGAGGTPKASLTPDMSAATMLQGGTGPEFPTDQGAIDRAAANPGPCTSAARDSMPDGAPHDHQQIAQHAGFKCAVTQRQFLPLVKELTDAFGREDVVLGEMDVKADIAAVAVTFPRSGAVFFDVEDPAKPKLLSIYRGGECDAQPIDINCGAFIDLAADGKVAYLSVQNLSSLPDPSPTSGRPGTSGVEVLSLADPRNPQLVQIYTVTAGVTGTHTSRSHVIPAAPPSGPNGARAPGEYIFSNQNSVGVNIAKVERLPGGLPQVRFVNLIRASALHDTFIQNDPTDNRTYLYLADGFGINSAFVVYDVTDPAAPRRLGQWDLTPECEDDWYAHTIDVTTRNGHRYVTMPAELFADGDQEEGEAEPTCGRAQADGTKPLGNGNLPGPLWIVDATDFSKLAQSSDSEAEIKRKSEELLVATWENPAGRAGGNLTFSPHNQQIIGDTIYLSHYHGGVYKLDATKAFDGVRESGGAERPRELGFVVPSGEPSRKDIALATNPLIPFITAFPLGHPEIWDAFFYRGCTLAADETGGFYSYEFDGDPCTPASGGPLPGPPVPSLGPLPEPRPEPARGRRTRFRIVRRDAVLTRGGSIPVLVHCRTALPCRGTLRLRTARALRGPNGKRPVRLGRKDFSVRGGRTKELRVRVSPRGRALLRRRGRTQIRASATVNFGPSRRAGRARAGFPVYGWRADRERSG